MLPGAEVQLSPCNGHHALPAHDGTLEVCIGIVLIPVVLIVGVGLFRGQFLQPTLIVLMQATLVISNDRKESYTFKKTIL